MNPPAPIDRSVKALIREFPSVFLRLAGIETAGRSVRVGDVSINLPEYRTDNVLIIDDNAPNRSFALQIEYQLQPDRRVLEEWFFKNAGLTRQLRLRVFLVSVYLTRGRFKRFPDSYTIAEGNLSNEYRFQAVRIWEHAERIRSGELAELAPLLVLCEDRPTQRVVEEERELIRRLQVPDRVRADLLAIALTVGARYFTRDLLLEVFREGTADAEGCRYRRRLDPRGSSEGARRGRQGPAKAPASREIRRTARIGERTRGSGGPRVV